MRPRYFRGLLLSLLGYGLNPIARQTNCSTPSATTAKARRSVGGVKRWQVRGRYLLSTGITELPLASGAVFLWSLAGVCYEP